MPIKYCPHCAFANSYSFESPIKCEKCYKEFASAFAVKVPTIDERPRKSKISSAKKTVILLPEKRTFSPKPRPDARNPQKIQITDSDLTDLGLEEEENDIEEDFVEDGDVDFYSNEAEASIDLKAIKINDDSEGSVERLQFDAQGNPTISHKRFETKTAEDFRRK